MILEYAEPLRAAVTKLSINGRGRYVRVDPGAPITVKGRYIAQNPAESPTDTAQIILFLNEKFFKCVYNEIPAVTPEYSEGTFTAKCHAPTEQGKYRLLAGWAYNWNWPHEAYDYIRYADPERLETVGVIMVGPEAAVVSWLPAVLVAIPVVTVIGLAVASKR